MRICIYGAGAMGTSLGAYLVRSDPSLVCDFVTRNRDRVASLKKYGAVIVTASGSFTVPVNALLPEEMHGTYDVVFLATKQRENGQIAEFLRPFLKEDGALVTVQNGLPEEGLASVLGADHIYGCTLGWGAELTDGGKVSVTSEGKLCLALGAYGSGQRLGDLEKLLSSAFTVTKGDLSEIRYSKLTVNAAFSTLSAISGLTFGELAKKHKGIVLALMRETVAVARAAGCVRLEQNGYDIGKLFSGPFAGLLLPVAMKKHSKIRSGMLRDINAGRRCDVDFVAGAVVRAGEKYKVATPKLRSAVALVHDIENGLAELSPETLTLLD